MAEDSPARRLFDKIAQDPLGQIIRFVDPDDPAFEGDFLEFKRQPAEKLKDLKWKELWSEALCGFANADGGVVVWGVKAKKDSNRDVDAASELVPVKNPLGVKDRLLTLYPELTNPTLSNVEVFHIPYPEGSDTGFVVCYVPRGPHKPYCILEQGGENRYLHRVGDRFVTMPRHLLRDAFFPQRLPRFVLRVNFNGVHTHNQTGEKTRTSFTITLSNEGDDSARDVCVVLSAVGVTISIHPSMQSWGGSLEWLRSMIDASGKPGLILPHPLHPGQGVRLPYVSEWELRPLDVTVYCDRHKPQKIRVEFTEDERNSTSSLTKRFDTVIEPI